MSGAELTSRHLNRALLARQGLLEPLPLPIPEALDAVGAIQAQYAPAMYVGLWSRMAAFRRDALTRALEQRSVVQGTLLRSTIHLVSAADYWPFALGVREARRAHWLRLATGDRPVDRFEAAAKRLRDALAEHGPLRRAEVEQVLGDDPLGLVSLWLDLVRVPPSGTWERRRADLYQTAESWLGPPPPDLDPEAGITHLARRYLAAFGPASARDIASWAGLPFGVIRRALQGLDLRRHRGPDGKALVDLPDLDVPDPDTPAPVRFLPTWDATLLAHGRRTGVLAEEHRPRVFSSRNPQSVSTFLVDGAVAGTWRYDGGHISVIPFDPLPRGVLRAVEEAAEPLAAFHA